MSTNDGGPAFPVQYSNEADGPTVMPSAGMTLRDYFAAKAMQGMLTCPEMYIETRANPAKYDQMARQAYAYASAMLKAREAE